MKKRLSRRARRQIARALLRAYLLIEQLRLEVERLRDQPADGPTSKTAPGLPKQGPATSCGRA